MIPVLGKEAEYVASRKVGCHMVLARAALEPGLTAFDSLAQLSETRRLSCQMLMVAEP